MWSTLNTHQEWIFNIAMFYFYRFLRGEPMPLVSGSDGMQETESDPETGRLVLKKLRVK